MLAIMNVAIDKGFWDASKATQQELAKELAEAVVKNGLPGSGHTRPKHPVFDHVKAQIGDDLAAALDQRLQAAGGAQPQGTEGGVTSVTEVRQSAAEQDPRPAAEAAREESGASPERQGQQPAEQQRERQQQQRDSHWPWFLWATGGLALILLAGGLYNGMRSGGNHV
jgi:cobaltochelatase CobN